MEVHNDNSNASIGDEASPQMHRIHVQYKLQELADGHVTAVPAVPMTLGTGENVQNRVS